MSRELCRNPSCGNRRIHHERQDEMRGPQWVDVVGAVGPLDPVFCSLTCAIVDGWMSLKYEDLDQIGVRQAAWREKQSKRVETCS